VKSELQKFRDLPWQHEVGILLGAAFVLSLVTWIGYGFGGREHQVSTITNFYWKRVVHIETYKKIHESNTTWSPPNDAYNVKDWTESYLESHYDEKGNFSHTTLEWDTHYSYDVNRWKHLRTVEADAWDHHPKWPAFELATGTLNKMNRVSSQEDYYEIHVKTDEGDKVFKTHLDEFNSYILDETVLATVNGFGWVMRLEHAEADN